MGITWDGCVGSPDGETFGGISCGDCCKGIGMVIGMDIVDGGIKEGDDCMGSTSGFCDCDRCDGEDGCGDPVWGWTGDNGEVANCG